MTYTDLLPQCPPHPSHNDHPSHNAPLIQEKIFLVKNKILMVREAKSRWGISKALNLNYIFNKKMLLIVGNLVFLDAFPHLKGQM